jgi:hypothetical protein
MAIFENRMVVLRNLATDKTCVNRGQFHYK